jgi:hypothetical protein
MKKNATFTFAAMLTLAAAALLAPVSASAASYTLTLSTNTPTVGSSFTADLFATNVFDGIAAENLIGFGFDVFISDPLIASFTGVTLGPDFVSAGAVGADVSAFTSAPFLGPGDFTEPLLLATLTFQALATGPTSLGTITSVPANFDHGLLFELSVLDIFSEESIRVVETATVPEPSAMALIGSGLLALGLLRRRL